MQKTGHPHNLFIEQLNSTVDKIIQDVYSAADEAHKTMIQTNKEVMATIYEATEKITNFMLYIPLIETLKEKLQFNQGRNPSNSTYSEIQDTPITKPTVSKRWPHVVLSPDFKPSLTLMQPHHALAKSQQIECVVLISSHQ